MVWKSLKVWPLRGRLIISRTASSHSSFHWTRAAAVSTVLAPQKSRLQTDLPDQAVRTFSGVSCRTFWLPKCASKLVNAERLYFPEDSWRDWVVVVLSWLDTAVVSTCSMSFCQQGMNVWQSVTPCHLDQIADALLAKSDFFSKTTTSFCKQFLRCHFRSQRTFWRRFGAEMRYFIFWPTCTLAPGRYLNLDIIYSLFFSFLFFWKLIIGGNIFFSATVLAYPQPVLPSLPTVTVSGRNSVTIETPSLSGGDVSSFTSWEIQWRPIGGEWQTATIPTSSSSYTIPGELAGGVYDIRVRATSASSNSLYTWPVQILLSALPTVRKYC